LRNKTAKAPGGIDSPLRRAVIVTVKEMPPEMLEFAKIVAFCLSFYKHPKG
jgi:hypothetical protein